jgi:hypothetical protein
MTPTNYFVGIAHGFCKRLHGIGPFVKVKGLLANMTEKLGALIALSLRESLR